jgi:RimJ/RimL family protein N-acetyltransferase
LTDDVFLRDVTDEDLPILFEQQLDPEATRMAAFPARDREAFNTHWTKILADDGLVKKTIMAGGEVAGNMGSWVHDGKRQVGYWIGKSFWGRGIATRALAAFIDIVADRPLHAYVAKHNLGSVRVLEKCGFRLVWEGEGLPFEGRPVQEYLFELHAPSVPFDAEDSAATP